MCYATYMRHLGIDFGSKKIGLALSDESGVMAFPHSVVPNDAQLLKTIAALIETERVAVVVIGHSQNRVGENNPVQAAVEEFITDLTLECGVPIHLHDERFTTQEALRIQGRNTQTDAAAAAIILNSFLTRVQ